jgi:hypothetical protein
LEGTESIESQIFTEAMGTSMPSLILYTIDVVLFFLAVAFVFVGTSWLAKIAKPGSRHIKLGLVGLIMSTLVYVGYLTLAGDEENVLLDDLFGVFGSACLALMGYGHLRLCGFLKREHEARLSQPPSETARTRE